MADRIAELFLSHSTRKLKQMTDALEVCLDRLSEEQIWDRGGENENSIGNLILHLCGNIRHYIGHHIGSAADIRNRPAEFTDTNVAALDLRVRLRSEVAATVRILETISPERLLAVVPTVDGDTTALELIYQVVGHFQQHTGQIIFATKQLTGQDLRIYRPPAV